MLTIPRTLRSVSDLIAAGLARPEDEAVLAEVAARYSVAIPVSLLELMDQEAIRRQFIPSSAELADAPEDLSDPIGDDAYSPVKGVVHRYPDRVLLKPILVCPVYCRFCFRRETVGDAGASLSEAELDAAVAYIGAQDSVREVILTGGDPLMLPPPRLHALIMRLLALPRIELVRIHSRVPVADPGRVTPELVAALGQETVWLAVHVNHPAELSAPVRGALRLFADGGVPLLSQTVLLKGVNDDPQVLEDLLRALVRNRVRPYYLHHPDLARGTAHFRPSLDEGRAIVRALRGRLTGIALPTYVLDIPGGAGKVPIGGDAWDEERATVEDWRGVRHPYPPRQGG